MKKLLNILMVPAFVLSLGAGMFGLSSVAKADSAIINITNNCGYSVNIDIPETGTFMAVQNLQNGASRDVNVESGNTYSVDTYPYGDSHESHYQRVYVGGGAAYVYACE